MIPPGGPPLCAVCRCLMHPPSPSCPSPYICLSGDECMCGAHDDVPALIMAATFERIAERREGIPPV